MFCVLSSRKRADDRFWVAHRPGCPSTHDVVRVYVLQDIEDSEEGTTYDPGAVEPDEQVFRVVEELRVRELRAGRAAVAAGLI